MKFKTSNSQYLDKRKKFAEKYKLPHLWSLIDHWPLYVGVVNLSRFLAIGEALKSTLPVPGHVAEFGCWRGTNLLFMAKMLQLYDPHGSKMIHGFDHFEGLADFSPEDGDMEKFKGMYRGSLEELKDIIDLYQMEDNLVVHQGLIEETLPRFLEENKALYFSFIYCDTDLYKSTRSILEQMHPRLMEGGAFVFDEWNSESFPGETVAVDEFLGKLGRFYQVENISNTRQPTLLLRKTK